MRIEPSKLRRNETRMSEAQKNAAADHGTDPQGI